MICKIIGSCQFSHEISFKHRNANVVSVILIKFDLANCFHGVRERNVRFIYQSNIGRDRYTAPKCLIFNFLLLVKALPKSHWEVDVTFYKLRG